MNELAAHPRRPLDRRLALRRRRRHPGGPQGLRALRRARDDRDSKHQLNEMRQGQGRLRRARSCPPRQSGNLRRGVAWRVPPSPGATSTSRRQGHGQQLAGRVPLGEPAGGRVRGNVAGGELPSRTATDSTTWPGTSGSGPATGTSNVLPIRRSTPAVSHQPQGHLTRAELQPGPARRAHPPKGDQGWVASVCPQLLPALPARSPPAADDRHLHVASRIPVRGPRQASNREGDAAHG